MNKEEIVKVLDEVISGYNRRIILLENLQIAALTEDEVEATLERIKEVEHSKEIIEELRKEYSKWKSTLYSKIMNL